MSIDSRSNEGCDGTCPSGPRNAHGFKPKITEDQNPIEHNIRGMHHNQCAQIYVRTVRGIPVPSTGIIPTHSTNGDEPYFVVGQHQIDDGRLALKERKHIRGHKKQGNSKRKTHNEHQHKGSIERFCSLTFQALPHPPSGHRLDPCTRALQSATDIKFKKLAKPTAANGMAPRRPTIAVSTRLRIFCWPFRHKWAERESISGGPCEATEESS